MNEFSRFVPLWWTAVFSLSAALLVSLYFLRVSRARLRASEASFARAEAEWRHALDFADDAIYLVDLQEKLVRANEAFFRFVGYRPEEAIGQNIMRLIHGERENDPCPVCRARRERRDAVFVKEADDPMNRLRRPIEISVRIMRDRDGEPTGILQMIRDLSRQRAAEQVIRENKERYRNLFQAAFDGIAIHDNGIIVDLNRTLSNLLGYEHHELIGADLLGVVAEPSRDAVRRRLQSKSDEAMEIAVLRKDGTALPVEVRGKDFPEQGRTLRVVAVRDLRELKTAQQALLEEKERLAVTLRSIGEAVIVTDVLGRVQYLNPVAEKLIGWTVDEARQLPLPELCRFADGIEARGALQGGSARGFAEDACSQVAADPVRVCLERGAVVNSMAGSSLQRRDGGEFAVEYSAGPIRDGAGEIVGVVLAVRDVTPMRQLALQLSYQASHDALTGLPNRREFEQRLDHALQTAKEDGREHALCYFDLDQFKVVNDTCGHVAGDELLKQIAALLRTKIRDNDTFARLGGDEFGVLLEGCALAKALEIAEVLRQVVGDFRFVWGERTFDIGVSIGVAAITADVGSVTEVLSAADAACYVAKDLGRNRTHAFQPDDVALAKHHGEMEWAQRLSSAIKQGRLRLYGQALIPLHPSEGATGADPMAGRNPQTGHPWPAALASIPSATSAASRDTGSHRTPRLDPIGDDQSRFEVLVRLLDESGQLVPPMAFIPAAERYNLMPAVDRWVIATTLQQLRDAAPAPGAGTAGCHINLSGRSLCDEGFFDFVVAEFKATGVDPARIIFEITETAAVANFSRAKRFISELKEMGCRFALDDFGNGLSSFTYLKHLPVDYLKIDGNFVRDMATDPVDHAMVEAINRLGHVMGIKTIAEYVESPAVLERLRALGVDYAQGYAISCPVPIADLLGASDTVCDVGTGRS